MSRKKKSNQRKPSGGRPNTGNNPKPQAKRNAPVNKRSGNPVVAAQAKEIEQKKEQKRAAKEPKAVGAGFRKFSQISIVVLILGSLILSGLGTISTMNNNRDNADTTNNNSVLYDTNGNPLNGDPATDGSDDVQWSEVEGLELGDPAETGNEIPFEIPAENPADGVEVVEPSGTE